jgi:hypothetical protein
MAGKQFTLLVVDRMSNEKLWEMAQRHLHGIARSQPGQLEHREWVTSARLAADCVAELRMRGEQLRLWGDPDSACIPFDTDANHLRDPDQR